MNSAQPKVSIIITVYNGDRYLESSLQSIYRNDYKNFEIVCINDGSSDGSHEICYQYNQKYKNFKYYRQKNHGLAYSRNLGVYLAKGEYITFVDSDDLIAPEMLSYLIQTIQKYKADIAYVDLQTFTRETGIKKINRMGKEENCDTEQALERYFEKKWGNVCGGMFAQKLFHNVKFPVGLIYEDNVAKLQLFLNASRIVLTDYPYYYYRRANNSITTKKVSFKNLDILRVGYKQEKIMQNSKEKLSSVIKQKNYDMISDILYDILDELLQINGKWPKLSGIVPIRYLLKVLFAGLRKKPDNRIYIYLKMIKKIMIRN